MCIEKDMKELIYIYIHSLKPIMYSMLRTFLNKISIIQDWKDFFVTQSDAWLLMGTVDESIIINARC